MLTLIRGYSIMYGTWNTCLHRFYANHKSKSVPFKDTKDHASKRTVWHMFPMRILVSKKIAWPGVSHIHFVFSLLPKNTTPAMSLLNRSLAQQIAKSCQWHSISSRQGGNCLVDSVKLPLLTQACI